jgi:hypothetical protein
MSSSREEDDSATTPDVRYEDRQHGLILSRGRDAQACLVETVGKPKGLLAVASGAADALSCSTGHDVRTAHGLAGQWCKSP